MTHFNNIKTINDIFDKSNFVVTLDSDTDFNSDSPHIYIKYIGENLEKITIGDNRTGGVLRIFIYDKNPTKNYKLTDDVVLFLDGNTIDNIRFDILSFLQSPTRSENGSLYESVIEFNCYSCDRCL